MCFSHPNRKAYLHQGVIGSGRPCTYLLCAQSERSPLRPPSERSAYHTATEQSVPELGPGPAVEADVQAEGGPAETVRYADVVVTHPLRTTDWLEGQAALQLERDIAPEDSAGNGKVGGRAGSTRRGAGIFSGRGRGFETSAGRAVCNVLARRHPSESQRR